MRVAAVQLNSTADRGRNLETAERLVREAAADGAELVVLPEKWNLLGSADELRDGAENADGPAVQAAYRWASELEIHLVAGSFAESAPGEERLFNTSLYFRPTGQIAGIYRKIHMFDVEVGGVTYRESETEQPGDEIVAVELDDELGDVAPTGAPSGARLGLTICYDLRFPELYRILAVRGARILTVPSAFTATTGRDHWEVLIRARAIENQAFVIAPNQVGEAPPHYDSWGHSMIVDPWGRVLAEAPDEECFAAADLDFAEQERIRAELPSLANRRPEAYRWPQLAEASA